MPVTGPEIDAEKAAWVLHAFGLGGYPAGDFTRDLINLMQHADAQNKHMLAQAYPGIFAAINYVQTDAAFILQRILDDAKAKADGG